MARREQAAGLPGHRPVPAAALLSLPGAQSFEGLVNLAFVMLVVLAVQLMLLNYRQKGFLVEFWFLGLLVDDVLAALVVWVLLGAATFAVFALQLAQVSRCLPDALVKLAYALVQAVLFGLCAGFVLLWQPAPFVGGAIAMAQLVLSFKAHSYFTTNRYVARLAAQLAAETKKTKKDDDAPRAADDSRDAGVHDVAEARFYPKNVTLSDFTYFLWAPTLCYELLYPRTARIRKLYVLKELAAALVCVVIVYILFMQFMFPAFRNISRLEEFGLMQVSVQVFAIAIPGFAIWLLMFYAFFHCLLNALSEVLRFAARTFYHDFWNATSIDAFWRKWNLPVHEWLLRHVYLESIHAVRLSRTTATFTVFFFSALGHEYVLSLAFQQLRPWFFISMLVQAPFFYLQKVAKPSPRWGNILVWVSLFCGQPLIEVLYMREWFKHAVTMA